MCFEALDENHGLGGEGLLFCFPDLTMYRSQEVASCKTLGNSSDSVSLSGYLPHEMKHVAACTWSPGRTRILIPSALYTSKAFFLGLIFLCPKKDKRQDSSRACAQPHTVFLKQQLGGSENNMETAHPHNKEESTRLQCRGWGQRLVK